MHWRGTSQTVLWEADLSRSKLLVAVAGTMLMTLAPASAMAGIFSQGPNNPGGRPKPTQPTDVPAPPVALLFAMGAAGLVWGRHLGNKRNR